MVLNDFFAETRKRWSKAVKQLKKTKPLRRNRNRVTPLVQSPTYNGTVDATSEIDIQTFCNCRISLPTDLTYSSDSAQSSMTSKSSSKHSCSNSNVSYCNGSNSSDSAYNSARSSPVRPPVCYATVTYYNVDNEDNNSITTEYTILEYDEDAEMEREQNLINESLELVSSL